MARNRLLTGGRRRTTLTIVASSALAAIVFAFDLATPIGIAGAIPYVLVVLAALWLPWPKAAAVVAAGATVLTIAGYLLSPPIDPALGDETAIGNRVLSVLVLWGAALLVWRQKRFEADLADADRRLRETFEQGAVGFAHVGSDGRLLRVNACLAELLGRSADDLVGRALLDFVHPEDVAEAAEQSRGLLDNKNRTSVAEARFCSSDGSVVWLLSTGSVVRDSDSREVAILMYVVQDISERKRAEQHLETLKAAVESANDAVLIATPDDRGEPMIEYVNGAFTRMFGYESSDVVGRDPDLLCRPLSVAAEGSSPSQLCRGENSRRELRCYSHDGRELFAEWQVTCIRVGASIRHWVGIVRDTTDQRRIAEALRASERSALGQLAELETLYHAAPIGLAMFSPDLRFTRVNERLAEINGILAEQHIGRTPRDIVPDIADQVEPLLRRVVESRKPILGIEIEGETPKQPGVRRVWREQYYPVLLDGDVEGVGAVVEDITEQKRYQQHLDLVMRELNHRVKNSLAVVQSIASQTIRSSVSLDYFEQSFLGRIRALAETHTLLSETNWRSTDLRELVRVALRPYCHPAGENVVVAGPSLALSPSATLALSMVLHELATNATQYGALSVDGGRLEVRWDFEDSPWPRTLRLVWTERDGPEVVEPQSKGFGSQLVEFTVRHEFGGDCEVAFGSGGVEWRIAVDWSKIGA